MHGATHMALSEALTGYCPSEVDSIFRGRGRNIFTTGEYVGHPVFEHGMLGVICTFLSVGHPVFEHDTPGLNMEYWVPYALLCL